MFTKCVYKKYSCDSPLTDGCWSDHASLHWDGGAVYQSPRRSAETLCGSWWSQHQSLTALEGDKLLTDSEFLELRCYKTVKQPVACSSFITIFMWQNWFCLTQPSTRTRAGAATWGFVLPYGISEVIKTGRNVVFAGHRNAGTPSHTDCSSYRPLLRCEIH